MGAKTRAAAPAADSGSNAAARRSFGPAGVGQGEVGAQAAFGQPVHVKAGAARAETGLVCVGQAAFARVMVACHWIVQPKECHSALERQNTIAERAVPASSADARISLQDRPRSFLLNYHL